MGNAKKVFYTGVGSRRTPYAIREMISEIAIFLQSQGLILRTGNAKGADTAFSTVVEEANKEIYYPKDAIPEAFVLAKKYHGAWHLLNDDYCRGLHARNSHQVLGPDLKIPSAFLLCWTRDACITHKARSVKTGGTGTALSIADAKGIKIWNLGLKTHRDYWEAVLKNPTSFSPPAPPVLTNSTFPKQDKATKKKIRETAITNGYILDKKNLAYVCPTCNKKADTFHKETASSDGEIIIIEAYACICGHRDRTLRKFDEVANA